MNKLLDKTRQYLNLLLAVLSGGLLVFVAKEWIGDYFHWQDPENVLNQEMAPITHFCNSSQLSFALTIIVFVFSVSLFLLFFLKDSNNKNVISLAIDILLFAFLIYVLSFLSFAKCF